MKLKMQSSVLILFLSCINTVGSTDHCTGLTHFDPPLSDRTFSVQNNTNSELLNSSHEESRELCIQRCCNTDKCNILSFNQSLASPSTENCFLYFSPLDSLDFVIYTYAFNMVTLTLRVDSSTSAMTLKTSAATADTPTEKPEVISENVVDIINDTDVDMQALNGLSKNTDATMIPSSTTESKTIVPSPITESKASQASTSSILPSTSNIMLNENLDKSSTNTSVSTSQPTSKDISIPSASPTLSNSVHSTTLSSTKGLTIGSTNQVITNSTQQSQSRNSVTTASEQPSVNATTHTSTLPKSTTTDNGSENKTTENQNTVNMTNTSSSGKMSTTTTQRVLLTPTSKSASNATMQSEISSLSTAEGQLKTSTASMKNHTLPLTEPSSLKAQKTSENVSSTTPIYPLTPAPTMTPKMIVSSNLSTTTTRSDTTEATLLRPDSLNSTSSSSTPLKQDNDESNEPLVTLPNYTVQTDLYFNETGLKEDTVVVTSSSKMAQDYINNTTNVSIPIGFPQNHSIQTKTEIDIQQPISTVINNTIYFDDMNITFADTNQLKEEREESNALSAALIAALSFGILFFFAVLVLIGKRCFDSWQRRHYSRIDYLVNGMYN